MTQLFELPIPPSTNHLTATVVRNGLSRRVKTKRYRAWLKEAGKMLAVQRAQPEPSPVRICILVVGGKGMTRQRDCDNFIKGCLDLLVAASVIQGDSLMHVLGVECDYIRGTTREPRLMRKGEAYCLVEVTGIVT